MSLLEIGVFVDAHHLLTARKQDRHAAAVIHRASGAAMQLSLASGFAYRVIVADCSYRAAREVAEDFGVQWGFRIRHVPEHHGIDRAAVLSAEIADILGQPGLKTVVSVAPILPMAPAFETAHRAGKVVIALTTDVRTPGAADSVIKLPLDSSVLHGLVAEAVVQLTREGKDVASDQVVYQRLGRLQPGFSHLHYGYRNAKHMMRSLSETGVLSGIHSNTSAKTSVLPGSSQARPSSQFISTPPASAGPPLGATGAVKGRESLNGGNGVAVVRQLCSPLARQRETPEDLVAALREVLAALENASDFRDAAETIGLTVTNVISAGFRTAAPNYLPGLHDLKLMQIVESAIEDTEWVVGRSSRNAQDLRLFYGTPNQNEYLVHAPNQ